MATNEETIHEIGNSRLAGRIRFIAGLAVIVLAVGVLVARGAKNSMVYYITVTELAAKPAGADLAGLRVTGTVVPGTIERNDLTLRFHMTDGESNLPVVYEGVVPDTFAEEGEVVVEGGLGSDQTFRANHLMAKCPSKYDAEIDEEAATSADGRPDAASGPDLARDGTGR